MKFFLKEDYSIEENQEGSLVQTLVSISNRTKFTVVEPASIEIYSILREPSEKATGLDIIKIKPAFADMRLFLPRKNEKPYFSLENGNCGTMPYQTFIDNGCPEEVLKELVSVGYFLQITTEMGTKVTLIPSKGFLATLCRQLGVGKLEEGIDPMRDIYLASRLVYCDPFTLVYRTNGKFGKAFGCFSPKFGDLPQTLVLDFKEHLMKANPNMSVRHWEYTHSITSVDFSLNDKVFRVNGMRVTPGVRLSLSDIGDSSYTLRNVLYCNGGVIALPAIVQKKRSKELDVKEMVTQFYQDCLPELEKVEIILKGAEKVVVSNKGAEISDLLKKIGFESSIGQRTAPAYFESYAQMNAPATFNEVLGEIMKIPGKAKAKECKSCLNRVSDCIGKVFSTKNVEKLIQKED